MKKLSANAINAIASAVVELESVRDDAQQYYDDRSEGWQDGDKGQSYSEWIEQLEAAIEILNDLPEHPEQ